jgi:chaperone modulatory protein CbpM
VIGLDDLVRRFAGLERAEVTRWIANVDIARVELILEIRREFAVDDDVMPLLLGLLDQVYSLRRQMRRLCDAIEAQPTDVRDAIRRALPPNSRAQ